MDIPFELNHQYVKAMRLPVELNDNIEIIVTRSIYSSEMTKIWYGYSRVFYLYALSRRLQLDRACNYVSENKLNTLYFLTMA